MGHIAFYYSFNDLHQPMQHSRYFVSVVWKKNEYSK